MVTLIHSTSPSVVRAASWLTTGTSAEIQVSEDGRTWETLQIVRASDNCVPIEIDLGAYRDVPIFVRFAWVSSAGADPDVPGTWSIAIDGDRPAP